MTHTGSERKKRAVVLSSGGLDSTTVLAIAKESGFDIYSLSFFYGQRHEHELKAAKKAAQYFQVKRHLVLNLDLKKIGGSALTDDMDVPKSDVYAPTDDNDIPITYVPARNTLFLAHALSFAEVIGAFDIFIGVNAVDYSGYPDCRPEFIRAFETLANLATKAGVTQKGCFKVQTPLLNLSKAEIIKKGMALGVDYRLTHSCYDPSSLGEACGRCESCLLRKKGFEACGIKDPIIYQEREKGC